MLENCSNSTESIVSVTEVVNYVSGERPVRSVNDVKSMKRYVGNSFLTSASDVTSGQLHAPATLPPGKAPSATYPTEGCDDPTVGLNALKKRLICYHFRRSNHDSSTVQLVTIPTPLSKLPHKISRTNRKEKFYKAEAQKNKKRRFCNPCHRA
jgi:hypothetical protein